ncbi:MAG: hypothetical protein ACREV9_05720 [Burkholderiales bacterium]
MKRISLLTALLATACATNTVPGPPGPIETPILVRGDSWNYNEHNGYNGVLLKTWTRQVTETKGTSTTLALTAKEQNKQAIVDHLDGGLLQEVFPGGQSFSYAQPLNVIPLPIAPGASWSQRVAATDLLTGRKTVVSLHGRVRGWQKVSVPAGEFVALKIVKDMYLGDEEWWRTQTRRTIVDWYVPEVKWVVRRTTSDEYRDIARGRDRGFFDNSLIRGDRYVWELISFKVSPEERR